MGQEDDIADGQEWNVNNDVTVGPTLALLDSSQDYIPVIMDLIIETTRQYQTDDSDVVMDQTESMFI